MVILNLRKNIIIPILYCVYLFSEVSNRFYGFTSLNFIIFGLPISTKIRRVEIIKSHNALPRSIIYNIIYRFFTFWWYSFSK